MELLSVVTIAEAKKLLEENFKTYPLDIEIIPVENASGRFLAADAVSAETVPAFRRSTKDGYAVKASDVSGASETLPAFLQLKGEVSMGQTAGMELKPGEAVYVPTGGMVPDGADAVVMIEYIEKLTDDEISIFRPATVRENVINIGDDIVKGTVVLKAGKKLKPADLGVLTSIGCTEVEVYRKPVVSVISTGDEIVGPDEEPALGQIRDINTYTISAAVEQLDCDVYDRFIIQDDEQALTDVLRECHRNSDIVLLSGGSSVGVKDYSLKAITALGSPGVLCHGIAFKPGKPTIIANAAGKPVIGLPGHPVSALVVFGIIVRHLVCLLNRSVPPPETYTEAVLTENISGAPGRETWQFVKLEHTADGNMAVPVHGESGLITMLAEAFGTVRIPRNSEGINKGTAVKVYIL